MEQQERFLNPKLEQIVNLARLDSDDTWSQVDQQLPELCNDSDFLAWARANMSNTESSLRDLAGTILEASDTNLSTSDIRHLQTLMEDDGYPGFRAACALAKRAKDDSVVGLLDSIKTKLKKFTDDSGVSAIAEKYLKLLGK